MTAGEAVRSIRGKPSIEETLSKLAAQWHPTKNNGKQPTNFTAGSAVKVWWICNKVCASCARPHAWEAMICRRATPGTPTGCPLCARRKCCESSSFAAQRSNLMRQWDWDANADLDPRQIALSSNKSIV